MKRLCIIFLILLVSFSPFIGVASQDLDDSMISKNTASLSISNSLEDKMILTSASIYSPFFILFPDSVLNYTPIVLIPNPDWYDDLGLNYDSLTYVPEIKINESVVDLSGYTHQDLVAVGVDWDVSSYGQHSFHNLTYSVYTESLTLLASDSIILEIDLEDQPAIDYVNSAIEIGVYDDTHSIFPNDVKYTIYPDGLVLYSIFLTDEVAVYEGWITEEKYAEILDLIWSYNFINFKTYYYGPADNLIFITNYYTAVQLGNETYYKFFAGQTAPVVAGELWDQIFDEVKGLNYIRRQGIRLFGVSGFWGLTWRSWFSILGGSIGLVIVGFFASRFFRR
jgi:hypothetical protein